MIVFEYLYGMMAVFGPLMDDWAHGNHRHIENEDDDDVRLSSLFPGSPLAPTMNKYVGQTMILLCFVQEDFVHYISPGPIARALVLSLSLCYHARLEKRTDYETGVVNHFTGAIALPGGAQQFRNEIRW